MVKNIEEWFTQEELGVRMHQCKEPYQNIWIGSDPRDGMPKDIADKFDAIVNVSCGAATLFHPSRPDQRTYWVPVNEMGVWNYSAFAHFCTIMNHHHEKGHMIYVHCAAGAYRSPTMTKIWLYLTGKKDYQVGKQTCKVDFEWSDAEDIVKNSGAYWTNYFLEGNAPPKFNEYLARMKFYMKKYPLSFYTVALHSPKTLCGHSEIRAKVQGYKTSERIKRPFRRMKYKFNDLKEATKLALKGKKQILVNHDGACRSYATIDGDDFVRKYFKKKQNKTEEN